MLVLTRSQGQSLTFTVGEVVFVVKIDTVQLGKVRVVIDAPMEVKVVRTELLEREQA